MSQPLGLRWLLLASADGLIPIGARGMSYFRIGWEWVKAALDSGWQLIRCVRFVGNHDPDPVMASRKQHERRCYRLEFNIQTYQYVVD